MLKRVMGELVTLLLGTDLPPCALFFKRAMKFNYAKNHCLRTCTAINVEFCNFIVNTVQSFGISKQSIISFVLCSF